MFSPNHYTEIRREAMAEAVRREGFDPLLINDPPGAAYPPHTHPETKLLAFVSGSMTVTVKGEEFHCRPGDRMVIPGNLLHEARVGPEGCSFFWSEKLLFK